MAIGRIPEPGTGIPESIIAAKGDLIVGTANDVPGILSVGTNGHTLVADSSVSPTGLKWAVDPVADVVTTAGDLIYGTAADTVARLGIGTAGQVLKVNSGATAPEWAAAGGASLNAGRTYVATQEGTNSNDTYVDLATVQSVTVTTGTKALVAFTCKSLTNQTANLALSISFAVSGATTLSASDDRAAMQYIGINNNMQLPVSGIFVLTGLTAGSNTFTLKFKGSTGSEKYWENRHISVVDLGS